MTLQIQEGKSYRARNGEVYRNAQARHSTAYPWRLTGDNRVEHCFTEFGGYFRGGEESIFDLIAEVVPEEQCTNGEQSADGVQAAVVASSDHNPLQVETPLDVPTDKYGDVDRMGGYDDETAATAFAPLERITPAPTRATDIAARASDLVGGDRDRQHGAKRDNFGRIATAWNAWLNIRKDPAAPLDAHDVGVMMVFMKMARTQSGAMNIDDYVDAAGYAACAGEVAQVDQ